MHPTRVVLFLALGLLACGSALGQRPGPEFWRKVGCEPFEPRTKLEAIDDRHGTVIIKAFTRITTIEVRGVRIDAVDMREMGGIGRARGIVVSLREEGGRADDNRAFVDYEELDALLNAIDAMVRVDETMTRMPGFEARYKTLGDLEVGVFRQTRSGTAVLLATGICDRATQTMTLDDLAKVKAMIQEAKTRLDESR
ncbi:MAG TPA: hypothetical protein VJ749_16990 [Pyrinomonadaceae bacterium]|jgi:hypothetical protein|nr:hypothetical protein [Pyrinomonadaceae bacterium]